MANNKRNERIERRLGNILKNSGLTISAAESCTGGRIAHLITTISGSSEYFLGSVTSYAISVKETILGVPSSTINDNGVVSSEVAAAMAEGVRRITGSTFAISTTGLAEGGDDRYPEGTVWIGVSGPEGTETVIFHSDKDRKGNIKQFTDKALTILYNYICKHLNS